MSTIFMLACVRGDTIIRVSTTDEVNTLEMKMAMVFVKSISIAWKASGHSCGVGCARIGAYPKKNFRFTWVSSSLCTMLESEAKGCFLRSLSYWSHKTPESNMSLRGNLEKSAAIIHQMAHRSADAIALLTCSYSL